MSGSPARRPGVEDLVDAYRADLAGAGMFAGHPVTSVARMFFTRVGSDGWARLPLAAQCALPLKDRRVVGWLIVTGRLRPSADYLVACRPYLGEVAARHHRVFHDRFAATSAELGFERIVIRLQWSALAKVTALAGLGPEQVTQAVIDEILAQPATAHFIAGKVAEHFLGVMHDARDGGRLRPSPARQPWCQSAERGIVRRADHLVPPRRARCATPQGQLGPLG